MRRIAIRVRAAWARNGRRENGRNGYSAGFPLRAGGRKNILLAGAGDHFNRMFHGFASDGRTAQHTGDLARPRLFVQLGDVAFRAVTHDGLRHHEMRVGMAGNARKMIDERFEQGYVRKCLYDYYDEILKPYV